MRGDGEDEIKNHVRAIFRLLRSEVNKNDLNFHEVSTRRNIFFSRLVHFRLELFMLLSGIPHITSIKYLKKHIQHKCSSVVGNCCFMLLALLIFQQKHFSLRSFLFHHNM